MVHPSLSIVIRAENGASQKAADIFRHGTEDALPAITAARAAAAEQALGDLGLGEQRHREPA